MTTLADLAPARIAREFKTVDGRVVKITIGVPSYHTYREILASVPMPPVPMKLSDDRKTKVPDRDSIAYQKALADRAIEQDYRVIAEALAGGGMDIPGATYAEKSAYLRTQPLDAGLISGITVWIGQLVSGVSRSEDETFRPVSTTGSADLPPQGADA